VFERRRRPFDFADGRGPRHREWLRGGWERRGCLPALHSKNAGCEPLEIAPGFIARRGGGPFMSPTARLKGSSRHARIAIDDMLV
jgi:hypothetical protein